MYNNISQKVKKSKVLYIIFKGLRFSFLLFFYFLIFSMTQRSGNLVEYTQLLIALSGIDS